MYADGTKIYYEGGQKKSPIKMEIERMTRTEAEARGERGFFFWMWIYFIIIFMITRGAMTKKQCQWQVYLSLSANDEKVSSSSCLSKKYIMDENSWNAVTFNEMSVMLKKKGYNMCMHTQCMYGHAGETTPGYAEILHVAQKMTMEYA